MQMKSNEVHNTAFLLFVDLKGLFWSPFMSCVKVQKQTNKQTYTQIPIYPAAPAGEIFTTLCTPSNRIHPTSDILSAESAPVIGMNDFM